MNIVRQKRGRITLLVMGIVLAGIGLSTLFVKRSEAKHLEFHTPSCTRNYGERVGPGWQEGGYHYQTLKFTISGPGYADVNQRIESSMCVRSVRDSNLVSIGDISWDASSEGGGIVKPVDAWLGVPRHPAIANGVWFPPSSTGLIPSKRPPQYAANYGRFAAFADDGGGAAINGQPIWCVSIESILFRNPVCGPDVASRPASFNGAGFMFINDGTHDGFNWNNCPDGQPDKDGLIINCSDGNNFNWYRAVNGNSNSLKNVIKTDTEGNLKDFDLRMEAIQKKVSGFEASFVATFKYPRPTSDYNHQPTLSSCGAAPGPVIPGATLCFRAGMDNRGNSRKTDGTTWVEFKNPNPAYVEAVSVPTPPLSGDTYAWTRGYNGGCMASGEGCTEHYFWGRYETPKIGEPLWSVQYQPVQYRIKPGTPAGVTICFRNAVTPGSPTEGARFSAELCYVTTGASGEGCPSMPVPNVPVTLNDTRSYPAGGASMPSGGSISTTTSSPPFVSDVYQDVNDPNPYQVTSANDEWGQSATVIPGIGSRGGGTITVGYQPFIDEYPYDYHNPNVTYNQYFTRYTWTATVVYAGSVYHPEEPPTPPSEAVAPTCFTSGGFLWCYGGSPGSPGGPGRAAYTEYFWNYYYTGSSASQTGSGSQAPFRMPPCWNREFRVTTGSAAASFTPDRENPNTFNFSGAATVEFSLPQGEKPLRAPFRVNIPSVVVSDRGANTSCLLAFYGGYSSPGTNMQPCSGSQSVSVPPLQPGDRGCSVFTVSLTSGSIDPDGNIFPPTGPPGNWNACSDPIVNWPYFEVFSNDVVAGGRFGATCSVSAGNAIRTYFRPGEYTGSSTQYAAFALGTISGFTSASLRQGAPDAAQAPFGLTFANTSGGYGGSFSATDGMTCLPDYFASRPPAPTMETVIAPTIQPRLITANTNPKQIEYYYVNGDLPLSAVANVPNNTRKVFYVDGTLTINNDIRINDSWTDRNQVSYIEFVARDIVIANGVSRLDGVYVAQPGNGGSGTIRTCETQNFSACRNPLVVNGALIAENIAFLRTRGSLRNSRQNEGNPSVPVAACSNGIASNTGTPGGNTCAAEIINFSPELFLALSEVLDPDESFLFSSYVTLPPNL